MLTVLTVLQGITYKAPFMIDFHYEAADGSGGRLQKRCVRPCGHT